jgi:hypothetical protein
MRLSVQFRLAGASMLLLVGVAAHAGAQPCQTDQPGGFGYIARLHAALTEQKAGECSAEACAEKSCSTLTEIIAKAGGIVCGTAECAGGKCVAWKAASKACAAECEGSKCDAKECAAEHCATHGCAATCDAEQCPAACALHKCCEDKTAEVQTPIFEFFLGTTGEGGKSICQTKSCARLASAGADCCCKDGGDCGCQSDAASVTQAFADPAAEKAWRLFQAAEHLEAAGLTVHAREVRAHAEREQRAQKEALLSSKLAALARLQAEIDALTKSLASPPQVLVEMTVLETPVSKLQSLGLDLEAMVKKNATPPAPCDAALAATGHDIAVGVVNADSDVLHLIETLEKCKLAKVVARPRMVTMSGQTASFASGGEFPTILPQATGDGYTAAIEYCEFGTRVNICPTVVGDDELHLEISSRVTELEKSKLGAGDESQVNSLRVRLDAKSTASMKPGQTLIIVASPQQGAGADEPSVLVLAKASLAKGAEAGKVAPASYVPETATLPTIIPPPATGSYVPGPDLEPESAEQ